MMIGGVLFGFFAGIPYWFPKVTGFLLNEKIGNCAAYCWITGFLVAFMPLYILGFMGATRRLDHYEAGNWLAASIYRCRDRRYDYSSGHRLSAFTIGISL